MLSKFGYSLRHDIKDSIHSLTKYTIFSLQEFKVYFRILVSFYVSSVDFCHTLSDFSNIFCHFRHLFENTKKLVLSSLIFWENGHFCGRFVSFHLSVSSFDFWSNFWLNSALFFINFLGWIYCLIWVDFWWKCAFTYQVEQGNFSFGSATTGQSRQDQNGGCQTQENKGQSSNDGSLCVDVFMQLGDHPDTNNQHCQTAGLKKKKVFKLE